MTVFVFKRMAAWSTWRVKGTLRTRSAMLFILFVSVLVLCLQTPGMCLASVLASEAEMIEKAGRVGRLLAGQIVLFTSLMLRANISDTCSALVVFGSPRYCDCRQCLGEQAHFRQKYCRFGELVRTSDEVKNLHAEVMKISGVDYLSRFLADDFYSAYCDFERCPSVPQRCCRPFKEKTSRTAHGCPLCLPVDERFSNKCLFLRDD